MKRSKVERHPQDEEYDDGYLEYPPDEDIYNQGTHETDIDIEEISTERKFPRKRTIDENDYLLDETGSGLDIPGAEIDDELEAIGSEDEENNYYSLSDDNLDDLEDLLER